MYERTTLASFPHSEVTSRCAAEPDSAPDTDHSFNSSTFTTMQVTAITLAAFAAMVSAAPQLITGTTVITQTTTYFHTVTAYQGANGPVVTSTQTPTTDDYHKLYFPDISTPTPLPSNWPKTRWIW
ncbi:hypothetical protein SNOG_08057 [Parastagonospora nodorum SN15]|uniref:Uncharacterized protein n=1 Tax=Phaeosphaeria nodorum (strain SN15 / ATCC MYA-4574 / FGSC 10173) TaxID=321614 RepID=Q0UJK7_PHANO|nr:hypothetical protein SNOG_08057 [Parastagonospora nodorum SN15]EAT84333.1 hypothetical protein SNOG_08057 [Parastagonospora nodorum SN15]